MSEKPFIKFYASDFLAGTGGLSPAERGVYITLLCLMYEHDGPIDRDDGRLARRCGAPKAAFQRILACLMDEGKITERDGQLSNRRVEKALVDRANRSQNATHAANSRWDAQEEKKQQNQGPDDADAMPAQCVADASQKPEPEYTEPIGSDGDAVADMFAEAVWKRGVLFLCERGVTDKNARSLIGKWIRDTSVREVYDAFTAAKDAGTGEPVSYITQVLKPDVRVSVADVLRRATESCHAK